MPLEIPERMPPPSQAELAGLMCHKTSWQESKPSIWVGKALHHRMEHQDGRQLCLQVRVVPSLEEQVQRLREVLWWATQVVCPLTFGSHLAPNRA